MNQPKYAGFWIRVAASLIDAIILLIVIGLPLTYIYGLQYWQNESLSQGVWDILLNYVFPIVATVWFWLKYRATPGKLLTGIQVVDASTYSNMTVGQASGRYFAYLVSLLPLFLGFVWVAFDQRKQGWHDKLAGTVVIYEE